MINVENQKGEKKEEYVTTEETSFSLGDIILCNFCNLVFYSFFLDLTSCCKMLKITFEKNFGCEIKEDTSLTCTHSTIILGCEITMLLFYV